MSIPERQRQILELLSDVWRGRHEYDLDTIDGTFYWRGCRWKLFDQLISEAKINPATGHGRLQNAIPGYGYYQGGSRIDELHIPMRGAVMSVHSVIEHLPLGETVDGRTWTSRAVIVARVRNADWTGADVAEAIHHAWKDFCDVYPDVLSDRPLISFRVGSPEHVVMDMSIGPDREGRLIDVSETGDFRFEPGETRVRVAAKPEPGWDHEPKIRVEVSTPPPARPVIASWFDDVAIDRHRWVSQLRGAKNGQDPVTAIRTWAAALLIAADRRRLDAFRAVEEILGLDFPSERKFQADKKTLLRRVPEARQYL